MDDLLNDVKILATKENPCLVNQRLSEMSNVEEQKNRMVFRRNAERVGEAIAMEISKNMPYKEVEIQTPTGTLKEVIWETQPVIVGILRAAMPLETGLVNYFDKADVWFASAYRKLINRTEFEIELGYDASADRENRIVILCDTMLATWRSLVDVYKSMQEKYGNPKKLYIVCAIASKQWVKYIKDHLPQGTKIVIGRLDTEELTDASFIVPGLGDAGDLAFWTKKEFGTNDE